MQKVKDFIKKVLANDVVRRAFKTFVQAFLAVLIAGLVTVKDFESAWALVVAAFAAGISAIWNYVKTLIK